jgi:hypothetical protein
MIAPAMVIGDLLAATRSMETGIRSSVENPAARNPSMDQRHDWAPESAMAVIVLGVTIGQLRPKVW